MIVTSTLLFAVSYGTARETQRAEQRSLSVQTHFKLGLPHKEKSSRLPPISLRFRFQCQNPAVHVLI